jgi:GTP1/Obg family GTP-binding protein
MEMQLNLLNEVKGMVTEPIVVAANKSDIVSADGYLTMSTGEGTGVDEVLKEILTHKPPAPTRTRQAPSPEETQE